jgi:hypothetical protein
MQSGFSSQSLTRRALVSVRQHIIIAHAPANLKCHGLSHRSMNNRLVVPAARRWAKKPTLRL